MECKDPEIAQSLDLFYIALDDRKLLSPLYSGLRNTIHKDRFLGAKTPIPPACERDAILSEIRSGTASLDATLTRTEREIELLREYRIRLTADVVTGKLDVREAAKSLPAESAEKHSDDTLSEPDLDGDEEPDLEEVEG